MNIIVTGALAAGAAWLLLRKPGGPASEAPKDANDLLATGLAPSLTDPTEVQRLASMFLAAANNQTDVARKLRLILYALAMLLKRAMLSKGAQPNALELLAIAHAPSRYNMNMNVLPDAARAVADGLNDAMTSVPALATYVAAVAQSASNEQLTSEQRKRLVAYALALQAKRVLLQNGASLGAAVYLPIANMPTSGDFGRYLAATSEPGASILRYS